MTEQCVAHQLIYFPFLGLRENYELRYGRFRIWHPSLLPEKVRDQEVRDRVSLLLEAHRAPSGHRGRSQPLAGIGIVSRGATSFGPLVPARTSEIQELRYALFLSCISRTLTMHGQNAGSFQYAAENFTFITQNFSLESEYFSETTGVLVRVTHLGYKIGQVEFPTPTYVPQPITFTQDEQLFRALIRLRKRNRALYRRIFAAASVFIESYYNTPSVDIRARVLLQAAAFEILLELPDRQQRLAFKDAIERLCSAPSSRRYRYRYETPSGRKEDSRTQSGIWADRFYTLRNHIIHGEKVRAVEYRYRRSQHHLLIAPIFFLHCIKRVVQDGLDCDRAARFYEVIRWHDEEGVPDDEFDYVPAGFRSKPDFRTMFRDKLAEVRQPAGSQSNQG